MRKAVPLAPAVLRLLLYRSATALCSGPSGACFVVVPSDMYTLGEPSGEEDSASYEPLRQERSDEDLDAPSSGPATDEYWVSLTWGALVSEDGTLGGVLLVRTHRATASRPARLDSTRLGPMPARPARARAPKQIFDNSPAVAARKQPTTPPTHRSARSASPSPTILPLAQPSATKATGRKKGAKSARVAPSFGA